jgi:hypothetical protein
MALDRIKRSFSALRWKVNALAKRDNFTWQEFKLTVTDPPRYAGHFRLIKNELIPFVEKHSLVFWVTNYHNATHDYVLFRIKSTKDQSKFVQGFLDDLKRRRLIVDWGPTNWDPRSDAVNRIEGLGRLGFDPTTNVIVGYDSINNRIEVLPDSSIEERQTQLTALFETVGDCTKAIYSHLGSRPRDLWAVSLFLHLVLNSLDYSGPDPPSEENRIRNIPVW